MMSDAGEIGYRKPPRAGRFRKGQSGNPKGRPKGRHKTRPHDDIFGRIVTIKENGIPRQVLAAEAFFLTLAKRALHKGGPAAELLQELAAGRMDRQRHLRGQAIEFKFLGVEPGSVSTALAPLKMVTKLDRYSDKSRLMLEPWIVEKALERLDEPLSEDEQREVLAATRAPQKVRWPDWWTVRSI